MTTQLLIVGAGGFARETAELVRAVNDREPTYDLLGYLDDDPDLLGRRLTGVPVLGPLEAVNDHPDAVVVACLGSPTSISVRRRVVERLDLPDERWATLIHPMATVSPSVEIGSGTVVHAGAVFTADIVVGRHVEVMPTVVLTHDDHVGDYCTFGAGARLAGGVVVGPTAYIGSGASIREGTTIGPGALVGMGSVITTDVPADEVWAGVPGRFIRSVTDPSPSARPAPSTAPSPRS